MRIQIQINQQQLDLIDCEDRLIKSYSISSAKNGTGQLRGSYCTPLGKHIIRAKIGEINSPELAAQYPGRDWILTRIFWLSGCEVGFNRLGMVDTMRRYIYIHGSPDSAVMGKPGSIGCIRMHNDDLLELFDKVPVGAAVNITQ